MAEQTDTPAPQKEENVPQESREEPTQAEPAGEAAKAETAPREQPETAATPAPQTSSAKERLFAFVLVAVIAAGIYFVGGTLYRQYKEAKARAEAANAGTPMECGIPTAPQAVGSKDAKVKLVASMGHCIVPAMDAMAKIASAWPEKIRAEFYALESPDGQQIVQEHGASRACVFINDKIEFTLKRGDKEETVRLEGPPGAAYQLVDIIDALRQTFEKVYGEVPENFDEVTAALKTVKFELKATGQPGCGLGGSEAAKEDGGSETK